VRKVVSSWSLVRVMSSLLLFISPLVIISIQV
jgi:hypothetical protein